METPYASSANRPQIQIFADRTALAFQPRGRRGRLQPRCMKPEIVVVGSLNLDLVIELGRFPQPGETVIGSSLKTFCGGKGANQAYAAAKLGAHVAMIGQVGTDAAGQSQISNLRSLGVDTTQIKCAPDLPTGTAV